MKCNQCGTEFEGKFCPECGAKIEVETPVTPPPTQQTQQQVYQQPTPTETTKAFKKKKKPFFLRWWFILFAIIVVGIIALSAGGGGEKIVWDDMVLGSMLPEPPANKGEIHYNSADELWVDINDLSDKQYADYVEACKEKGFTVDAESDSSSYNAYNADGYKLELSHYGSDADMSIQLEKPMEMTTIKWPSSTAGKMLPTPKSTKGSFSYEHDDNFFVYIGDTSKADYDAYVTACSEKGFNVDYDKGEDYYYADNSEGWHISLRYEGNNIMSIDIDAPSEEDDTDTTTPSTDESKPDTTEKEPEKDNTDNGSLDPEFKAAMDSYEAFMDEYVAFMKKYAESDGTDLSILTDYADYMSKYSEFVEDFEKWEDEEMNAAETAYYIEVQSRVSKKITRSSILMKGAHKIMRSKTLLVSNILASIYSAVLMWIFGGAVIEAGGMDFIDALGAYFELAFDLLGMSSPAVTFLYVIMILLCIHIVTFVLGCIIGWMAYAGKKSGGAKFAATLYLIGTICFPVYLLFGLPITIIGFVGGGKQKKINKTSPAM